LNSTSRRVLGILSFLILAGIVVISFHQNYGKADDYPLILNPKFKYLTRDPETGGTKPFLWEVTYTKGPNDIAYINHDTVEGQQCLGLHVYQDGANDSYTWANVHVKQTLKGDAVSRLFKYQIEMSVYPTFSFVQDPISKEPWNVFGLEINDGEHLVWFVFSDGPGGSYQLRNHRIVLVPAPLNRWSGIRIDVSEQYTAAGWKEPSDLSFILICGATKMAPGNYAGFYQEIRAGAER
jgi:hypothetical protein